MTLTARRHEGCTMMATDSAQLSQPNRFTGAPATPSGSRDATTGIRREGSHSQISPAKHGHRRPVAISLSTKTALAHRALGHPLTGPPARSDTGVLGLPVRGNGCGEGLHHVKPGRCRRSCGYRPFGSIRARRARRIDRTRLLAGWRPSGARPRLRNRGPVRDPRRAPGRTQRRE